jgi:ribosome biogenesis protein SSF1/2
MEFAPKSFVIKRGRIGMYTKELLQDTRDLLYPFTASKLKESKKNTLKDFIAVSGQFAVSHMLVFSQTDKSCYLRVIKNPKGPTVTFKIDEYSLAKDVVKYQ